MAILTVLTEPDPRLRKKSSPVLFPQDQDLIQQHLDDMFETMYASKGIGLAAPQVNIHLRLIVMHTDPKGPAYEFINPQILWTSDSKRGTEEGCLSVPQFYEEIHRPQSITVQFLDRKGVGQTADFSGLDAVCVQHEIDHLNGILFVDYLSTLKKKKFQKHLQRYIKEKQS